MSEFEFDDAEFSGETPDDLSAAELRADFAPTPLEAAAQDHEFQDLAHVLLDQARADARAKRLRPQAMNVSGTTHRGSDVKGRRRNAREPVMLGDAIKKLIFDRGWEHHYAIGKLTGDWASIVTPELAAHCEPTSFVDGVLTIQCASTNYATSLKLLLGTLQERIDREVGVGVVQKIEIKGPQAPQKFRGPLRVHGGRGPRDTYG